MKIISRKEALALGLKRYFTGKPCKHGHIAERWSARKSCLECGRERSRAWGKEHPQERRERVKRHRAKYPERRRALEKIWREKNADRLREKIRKYGRETYLLAAAMREILKRGEDHGAR